MLPDKLLYKINYEKNFISSLTPLSGGQKEWNICSRLILILGGAFSADFIKLHKLWTIVLECVKEASLSSSEREKSAGI